MSGPAAPIFILTADSATTITSCGAGFAEHFGRDVTGQMVSALISQKDRRGRRDFIAATTRHEGELVDLTLVLELGGQRLCRVRGCREGAQWWFYVEDLLRFAGDAFFALTESAQRWSAVIGQSDDGIAILNGEHRVVEFNERFLTLGAFASSHGISLNEESLTGRSLFDLTGEDAVFEEMQAVVELSRTAKGRRFRGVTQRAKRHVEVTTSAIHLPVHGFAGTCVILKDVTAQHMLEVASAQLRSKNADIQAMLQNVRQGIFTIVDGGVVHPEYSRHLEDVLGCQDLGGKEAVPLLLDDATVGAEQRSMVEAVILTSLGSDSFSFTVNAHLLPRQLQRRLSHALRDLELDWVPLENDAGELERILVTVRDVTELKKLEAERERQGEELSLIAELVAMPGPQFREFEGSVRTMLARVRSGLASVRPDDETVALLFRQYHTIKGNSRFHGLRSMSATAHEAEGRLATVRDDPACPWDRDERERDLAQVESVLDRYLHVHDEVLGRRGSFERVAPGCLLLSPSELDTLLHDAEAAAGDPDRSMTLPQRLRERAALTSRELLASALRGLPSVARDVGKPHPTVRFEGEVIGFAPSILEPIRDCFVHLLTNALDHGIEAPEVREARGLPAAGTITIAVARAPGGSADLVVWDDGCGLDVETLRKRMDEPEANDDDVAQSVFRSGLSSRETVSITSGRGVGMDAARRLLESIGGTLVVEYAEPSGSAEPGRSTGRRPVRFRCRVPAKHVWRTLDAAYAAA